MQNVRMLLSDTHKGILLMVAGIILILHTLGIIQKGLSILIILAAVYMIIVGFIKMDGYYLIQRLMKKFSKKA